MMCNLVLEGEKGELLQPDSSKSKARPKGLDSSQLFPALEEPALLDLTRFPNDERHAQEPSIPNCVASFDRLAQDFQGPQPHARIIFYLLLPYFLEQQRRLALLQPWPCLQPEPLPPQPLRESVTIPALLQRS